jgi:hypothetical protein
MKKSRLSLKKIIITASPTIGRSELCHFGEEISKRVTLSDVSVRGYPIITVVTLRFRQSG